ncbi:MAG: sn-glycerol-3-phosphate ABC transporter ATP-binding protein UgpC [Actinomycetota bacterium]|nr:sn-glycerol-3-phosphate ABC transporter ATP-binding protein UgpC [Actinomycetota bacterium]HZY66774.1 sn-glycerol-3-phosphate ABC transporter ATP-binding protein UgpC [Rubrobacteraceae bacterium]
MAEITFENVKKVYGEDVVAIENMSLDIPDGEFVVFVGPSGCGKSTALRMVAGLEDITDGKLFIADELVNDVPPRERDIAMVFQNYALYPHMNVRDNMAFALKLRKVDKDERNRRVEDAAKILGLENFLNRKPAALSGGQRQRVALGRAIVRDPKAFLMDEPLSNLDAKLRVQMRTEIAKLHNRIGTTSIYVTHDQTEAMTMADRIVLLKDGRVQQIDHPQQMYDHPANVFVAGFIGSPAMNFMQARLEKDNGGVAAVFGETRLPIPREHLQEAKDIEDHVNKDVVLGIRPEDIEDAEIAESTEHTAAMEVEVQVIESMGSEKYVYFGMPKGGEPAHTQSIDEMESEIGTEGSGDEEETLVARIGPESKATEGEPVKLLVDTSKIHLFDGETEEALL